MLELSTPRGFPISVPETPTEDPSPRFTLEQDAEILDYYEQHGYVIIRELIDGRICDEMRAIWDADVKPSKSFLYRQASARAERHVFNEQGQVMNGLKNLHSMNPKEFGRMRNFATNQILTGPSLTRGFRIVLKDEPKLMHSMYFEGNAASADHRDSYYFDSTNVGAMTAAWIALEDIHVGAGRFFFCPRSHRRDLPENAYDENIVADHETYITGLLNRLRELGYEFRAPALQKGDVVFWNSWLIHGSLDAHDPRFSRSSITVHAIPEPDKYLVYQKIVQDVPTTDVNGVKVYRAKDLASWRNRAVLWAESRFPKPFYWLKGKALQWIAARQARRAR